MPENAPVTLVTGLLPEGYCFTNWQQTYEDFIAATSAYVMGTYNFFNWGSQTPAASARGNLWVRLNPDGSPDRNYVFFNGTWVSPHPIAPGDFGLQMYEGTPSELKLKDGGEDAAVTLTTGPFWEIATEWEGRMPVGPGELPIAGVTVVNGGVGGVDRVTLSDQAIMHNHAILGMQAWAGDVGAAQTWIAVPGTGGAGSTDVQTSYVGDSGLARSSHQNMPPYRGVYFIRRTARKYYSLPG